MPLTEIYFNLLPIKDKTVVILGCQTAKAEKCWDYISTFKTEDKQLALKKISDLLITQVENWLCSPSFYWQHLRAKETEIVRLVSEAIQNPNERRELDFNLFDA